MKNIKKWLKPWIPPALLQAVNRSSRTVVFGGDYESWQAASMEATGYDSPEILRRVAEATRKVTRGEAAFERDSVVFDRVEYSWPLLASLLQVAAERRSLHVIDFGGSLGSTYRQNRAYLQRLEMPKSWKVVEQPDFVTLGKAEFCDAVLGFEHTIAEASDTAADVVLFAGSLCYVQDPAIYLGEVEKLNVPFLVIDRLPVIDGTADYIALQQVREPIYPASYPVRLFGEKSLLENTLRNWQVIEIWDCELQPDAYLGSNSRGYFLERRNA